MAQIIGLPKLSPTMEEGVLVRWVKKEGDAVQPGDLVAEVETDKANMDFNLEDEGVLLKLLVEEGATVKLGAPVAILGDKGEDISALLAQAAEAPAAAAAAAPPEPAVDADSESVTRPVSSTSTSTSTSAGTGAVLASPLAKTLAIELGIDLRRVTGTGPGGRIVERDVRAAATKTAQPQPAAQAPAPESRALAVVTPRPVARPMSDNDYVDRPLSNMRKTIARRLVEAKSTIPHFYLTASFDAAPLLGFRKALNALVPAENKITVNTLIVKGAALALRRVPEVNAAFLGDAIRYYARVHMGVAVSIDDGLVTPVVRDCDIKGIGVINSEIRDLAERARDRRLKGDEITGSTFTVSNLGMYGIDHFQAVINPPEGAILAVGTIRQEPIVKNEQITVGQVMKLTLSCDHRTVDGALGARYLDELIGILERPELLAL